MSHYDDSKHQPGDGLDRPTREKFGALETIQRLAPLFAKAKADRTYLEHFRKSKKALLMLEAERDHGHKSSANQERYAYAHPDYIGVIEGIREAIVIEETLGFQLRAADSGIRIWQTKQANRRIENKVIP